MKPQLRISDEQQRFWMIRLKTPYSLRGHRSSENNTSTTRKPPSFNSRPHSQQDEITRYSFNTRAVSCQPKPRSKLIIRDKRPQSIQQNKIYFYSLDRQEIQPQIQSEEYELHQWVNFEAQIKMIAAHNFYKMPQQVKVQEKQQELKIAKLSKQTIREGIAQELEKEESQDELKPTSTQRNRKPPQIDYEKLPFEQQLNQKRLQIRQNIEKDREQLLVTQKRIENYFGYFNQYIDDMKSNLRQDLIEQIQQIQ